MIEMRSVINLFNAFQVLHIESDKGENYDSIYMLMDLPDLCSQLASQHDAAKIYLNGPEEYLLTIKEEILSKSKTQYSNNNVEVEII